MGFPTWFELPNTNQDTERVINAVPPTLVKKVVEVYSVNREADLTNRYVQSQL